MADKQTIAAYDDSIEKYLQLTDDGKPKPSLLRFIELLPNGGNVLDLGCGPGTDASHMAKAGLSVTATDASPEMVKAADRHDGVNAQLAEFRDLTCIEIYDGVWANFSLLHAPKTHMADHLRAIFKALKTDGVFHIALKSGDGEKRDKLGRNYTYYHKEELEGLLTDTGFLIKKHSSGEAAGLAGDVEPWIAFLVQKPAG